MTARLLCLLLTLLASLPAAAQEPCPARRNVDCAGAARAIDAAIAADPWLAIMDRAQRMRLDELAPLLGAESAAELAAQQAAWRRSLSRNLFFHPDGTLDAPDPRAVLRAAMEYRLMQLIRIEHDPSASIDGIWAGVQGEVTVEILGAGSYRISAGTADINNLAWTCGYEGEGESTRVEWLETRDGALELRREGVMLRVRMNLPQANGFCGAAGSLSGLFFRIGDVR
ncbi:hypothetical protein [Neoroseomonas oryzicola]|uniref:DUF1311 domain-containing protein n=1 Tax=Neoroseomonas oryzicola TaxID=535904 RepID=A0A9X9WD05_9PROT|nr:hypothetical protein [Neoroseomonas oryzicola]MBR0658215.1 hypothetical protein [Neoroseomonas oryzicola]NKE15968.1 hypothetical protein [Neoroseomonas oryzicola]